MTAQDVMFALFYSGVFAVSLAVVVRVLAIWWFEGRWE